MGAAAAAVPGADVHAVGAAAAEQLPAVPPDAAQQLRAGDVGSEKHGQRWQGGPHRSHADAHVTATGSAHAAAAEVPAAAATAAGPKSQQHAGRRRRLGAPKSHRK